MFKEMFSRNGKGAAEATAEQTIPIDLRNVVKSYETAAGDFIALDRVSLRVDPGEFVAVVGKSGSGKSTLSNMITGIDRPTSGEVLVAGTPVHTLSEGRIAKWRGRNVGVVFQFFQLLPTLTVIENVMLPMDFCNMYSRGRRRTRALELLARVEMEDQAFKLPTALSGGQQQRVAIARALANDPSIIIADEPTGNLDSKTADAVFHLFEELTDSGKTILMVTHDEDLAHRATRLLTIADGRIVNDEQRTRTPQEHAAASTTTMSITTPPAVTVNGHNGASTNSNGRHVHEHATLRNGSHAAQNSVAEVSEPAATTDDETLVETEATHA